MGVLDPAKRSREGACAAVRRLAGVAAAVAALLLTACSGMPLAIGSLSSQASVPAAPAPSSAQLSAAALRANQRILANYGGVYEDLRLQAMIDGLVAHLAAASQRTDLRYRVTILNSPTVNAFALPTGQLYLTRGLITLANDESELAAVIGHEMGHVIARHAQLRAAQRRNAALRSRAFANLLSDPGASAQALAKSKRQLAAFSQAQELQADSIGIRLAAAAGYDPYGAVRFLASLERNARLQREVQRAAAPARPDFLSSHPATPARIARALVLAAQYTAAAGGPTRLKRARDGYLADLNGMIYGQAPSEGLVRGRRFIQPRLGFTFTAPQGFVLRNTAPALLGVRADGGAVLRLDVVPVPGAQTLSSYLTSGWIKNVDDSSIRTIVVNGLAGATATARRGRWQFRLYVIRLGGDVYRFVFAARPLTRGIEQAFRRSVDSFRRLSAAQIARIRPERLRIVTVRRGDRVRKLARRMAVFDRRIERFRVLNGLDPAARLKPGTRVKMVVE